MQADMNSQLSSHVQASQPGVNMLGQSGGMAELAASGVSCGCTLAGHMMSHDMSVFKAANLRISWR